MGCVFCDRIARGEYDFQSGDAVSFVPLNPVVAGHRLFLPIRHTPDARDANGMEAATSLAAEWVSRHSGDFNLITSAGPSASQTVFHLHVHYVPRTEDDGLKLPWTGQVKHVR